MLLLQENIAISGSPAILQLPEDRSEAAASFSRSAESILWFEGRRKMFRKKFRSICTNPTNC